MTLDVLSQARDLLKHTEGLQGVWHRAAALLTRQVLEEAIDGVWDDYYSDMKNTNRYTQLACLKQLARDNRIGVGSVISEDAHSAWMALSRACHHHEYDLVPTVPEIELWISQVGQLVESMGANDTGVVEE